MDSLAKSMRDCGSNGSGVSYALGVVTSGLDCDRLTRVAGSQCYHSRNCYKDKNKKWRKANVRTYIKEEVFSPVSNDTSLNLMGYEDGSRHCFQAIINEWRHYGWNFTFLLQPMVDNYLAVSEPAMTFFFLRREISVYHDILHRFAEIASISFGTALLFTTQSLLGCQPEAKINCLNGY